MDLKDWLAEGRGRLAVLAADTGVAQSYLWQMVTGRRPMPSDRCPAIERATEGKVTCEELRPDVRWARIVDPTWPHPNGRPAIDVAAPAVATTEPATQET